MSILGVIDKLSPKDRGSRRLAAGLAYGSEERQRLDIYGPKAVADTPLPVVVFIYGGAWDSGDRREYGFAGRALAALGYIVAIADYRVVPAVEYPAFLEDCTAALAWVVDNIETHGGDPLRLALVGHSSGAYNAVMIALAPRWLAARGLVGRIKAVVGLSGPYDFFPFDVAITLRVFGAVRDGLATQPVNWVSPQAPPMLLATGDADKLVYPRNTVRLAEKLRDAGVPVTERHYAGANHPMPLLALGRLLRWRLPVLGDVADFLGEVFSRADSTPRAKVVKKLSQRELLP